VITIRRARLADAVPIAAVHVAAWRSTYPGILPDDYLARMSVPRQAAHYERAIRGGTGVHVATASGVDLGAEGGPPRVVGFATAGPCRAPGGGLGLADGEIETLYVLDDWRERGIGRRLMRAAAGHLAGIGCTSAFVWVLRENPARWFYERLGGKTGAESLVEVGGQAIPQTAYVWSPLEKLVAATQAT
jgi:GNAT superfamily N-acetyltransferase